MKVDLGSRRRQVKEWVLGLPVKISESAVRTPLEDLVEEAMRRNSYNVKRFNSPMNEIIVKRWTVNFIRHEHTNYEEILDTIEDGANRDYAYGIIKCKVNSAITDIWKELRLNFKSEKIDDLTKKYSCDIMLRMNERGTASGESNDR